MTHAAVRAERRLDNNDRYCLFACGEDWFALPALNIHSVVPAGSICPTPCCDPLVKGLCHVQNEFIPLVSFRALMTVQYVLSDRDEQQVLILEGPSGRWGLAIDQALHLTSLEISYVPYEEQSGHWSNLAVGSASYENRVIHVLDATSVYRYAETILKGFWQSEMKANLSTT